MISPGGVPGDLPGGLRGLFRHLFASWTLLHVTTVGGSWVGLGRGETTVVRRRRSFMDSKSSWRFLFGRMAAVVHGPGFTERAGKHPDVPSAFSSIF